MNKIATLLCICLLSLTAAFGQRDAEKRDQIKTLKIAFITDKLALTEKEAQAFWPVYNTHEKANETLRYEGRNTLRKKISGSNELTEKQALDVLEQQQALITKKYKADQDYFSSMKKIISAKKILLLLKAEEDFRRQLFEQYRNRKEERP